MTDKEKVAHLVSVKQRVRKLTAEQALAFGLLCVERMLPVYAHASTGRDWARPEVLRSGVDEAWASIASGGVLPAGGGEACEGASPSDDDLVDDEAIAAHTVANAVAAFFAEAEDGDPTYAHFMASRAIELLELLEDASSVDPLTIERLLRSEMSRQEADLGWLRTADAAEIGLKARAAVGASSVFGSEKL